MPSSPTRILDPITNKVGTFWGVGVAPPAGTKQATVAVDLTANEVTDPTNFVRLQVWADFGAGPKCMAVSAEWHGGPGQSQPALTWSFSASYPPLVVYGIVENGTRGLGSPAAINQVTITFA